MSTTTLTDFLEVPEANGSATRMPSSAVPHFPVEQASAPVAPAVADKKAEKIAARMRLIKTTIGSVLMVPGLGMSAWSMYSYIRTTTSTAPVWVAGGASSTFDGLALFAALMAHEAAKKLRPGRMAKYWVYISVATSTVINWAHASTQHWPLGIHLMLAAPAVMAAGAFELILEQTKADEREKRDPRRRTRRSAKVDIDLYLRHPWLVWKGRQDEAKMRLEDIFPENSGKPGMVVNSKRDFDVRREERPSSPARKLRDGDDGDSFRPGDDGDGDGTGPRDGDERRPRDENPGDGDEGTGTNVGDGDGFRPGDDGDGDGTGPRDGDERRPRDENPGDENPGDGNSRDGDEGTNRRRPVGPRPRLGTSRTSRPRTAGHVAGSASLSDEDRSLVARVAREMKAADERINRDNLAPRLRDAGVRRRNNEWGPYVEAAKRAVA